MRHALVLCSLLTWSGCEPAPAGGISVLDGGTGLTGTGGGAGTVIPFLPQTVQSSIAVDGQGRLHAGALGWDGNQRPQYSTCASGCGSASGWSTVELGTEGPVDSVLSLRVTADGRPRLATRRGTTIEVLSCEGDCLRAASWQSATAATGLTARSSPGPDETDAFAIDGAGRAALFFTTSAGLFIARCASGCAVASSWSQANLGPVTPRWDEAHLLFLPSGALALAVDVAHDGLALPRHVGYFECAATDDCANGANWKGVVFRDTASSARLSLALDAQGHPRLAIFYDEADPAVANTLRLLSCDAACATPGNWVGFTLPWTGRGSARVKRVSLAFDAQNHGLFAWRTADAAWLGRCSTGCVASSAGWTRAPVADSTSLGAQLPLVASCPVGAWTFGAGHYGVFAAPDGTPVLGYDVEAAAKNGACGAGSFEARSLVSTLP